MKLSVLMITYNHEKFISQALDSILTQEVNFSYEIVIGEDCSTDGTRSIVIEYQKKYPDIIRLLLPEKNLGMINNLIETYSACQGQYIAILEGDDFWTSPNKLQKQVDFLDSHPECTISFHNVDVVYENLPEKDHLFHSQELKQIHDLEDIISCHFIPTCSTVFRNKLFADFPEWFHSMPMGDWPLHILNAHHGDAYYIDKVMATYRVHEGGTWTSKSRVNILNKTIAAAKIVDRFTNYKFTNIITRNIAEWHYEAANILCGNDLKETAKHVLKGFAISPLNDFNKKRKFINLLIIAVVKEILPVSL